MPLQIVRWNGGQREDRKCSNCGEYPAIVAWYVEYTGDAFKLWMQQGESFDLFCAKCASDAGMLSDPRFVLLLLQMEAK